MPSCIASWRRALWLPLVVLLSGIGSTLAPTSANAAIAFVGASQAENGSGSSTLVITKPTGVAEGGLMVATVTAAGTGAVTTPSGWTVIKSLTGTTLRQVTYYKVAGGSEPASYSWSLGSSRAASGGIVDYSGVNQTVPVDATASTSGESGNGSAPTVTTSAADELILAVASFATGTTVTPDASTTERIDANSATNTTAVADFAQASAGATTAKTITPAAAGAWIGQTIALRDAAQATLAIATTAAPSFTANLNSGDQTKTFTVPLTLSDTRTGASAGLGWNTTITSSQFTTGTRTLPTNVSTVTATSSACANGGLCTNPTSSITYPLAVPAGSGPPTAVKFYSAAAATGKGVFTLTPTVSVAVPQNSFTGTYTSTLTISVVSGP